MTTVGSSHLRPLGFKKDSIRPIDLVIDYFGEGAPHRGARRARAGCRIRPGDLDAKGARNASFDPAAISSAPEGSLRQKPVFAIASMAAAVLLVVALASFEVAMSRSGYASSMPDDLDAIVRLRP